jgi:hypothetical protein
MLRWSAVASNCSTRWIEILVSPDSSWMTGAVVPLDGDQVLDIA